MDNNAIKKYAIWARSELISRVEQRAEKYDVTDDGWGEINSDSVNGYVLSSSEKKQRIAFIKKVQGEGYEQAIEEVAYTWFNRFCALRYMEVNGYLPSHIRVFTNDAGYFKPEILDEALHLDIEGLDMDKVLSLKENAQKTEELFRYLLITQCNALNAILPGMFQKIEDYTELLLPENLLREGSVIEQMITLIPEKDWTDQVQIIGWLYQYYNAEKKDEVFAALKKNVKITKENIPAATQLFTPDWIVRYMVENSLGRLWVEGHPNEELKTNWKYYLEEADQEPEVEAQLAEIRKAYSALKPEDIKCIDPCCGSGHILCYMFDVLIQIYESYGYTTQEAVSFIVKNNLYGLDIDERAAQLAYFAVMMKARSSDRRFFSRGIQPHVYAICESNDLDQNVVDYFVGVDSTLKKDFGTLVEELHDAKEYGSILNVSQVNFDSLYARVNQVNNDISLYASAVIDQILPLINVARTLAQKFDVVVTNPPYMGSSSMGPKLSQFVKKYYPEGKSDLFAVFVERCGLMTKENGYQAMITQQSWMFLSSFEKLRSNLMTQDIVNMIHLGSRAFEEIGGEVVQTTSFVLRQRYIISYKSIYCRLIDPNTQQGKEDMFLSGGNRYVAQQSNFSKIPGSPVAYWVSESIYSAFDHQTIENVFIPKFGMSTGDGDRFIRFWYECSIKNISFDSKNELDFMDSGKTWCITDKGGNYRRWYGNKNSITWWKDNGIDIKNHNKSTVRNSQYFFKPHISWTLVSSGSFSARYFEQGFLLDTASNCLYYDTSESQAKYVLGYLNSKVSASLLNLLNPTINMSCGVLGKLPYIENNVEIVLNYVNQNISFSKSDWDNFETSWDFQCHPLVRWNRELWDVTSIAATMSYYYGGHPKFSCPLELCYILWQGECNDRINKLKANEEELNRIFIDIYGLQDELTPEEEDKNVTVRKSDLQRDIKSLISYAVGCMFGRYSLDVNGLAYAGGEWDPSKYMTFLPDTDAIIPICDDEYFTDDIVGRFVEFIRVVYGEDTLEENLQFVADALGGNGSSREIIRKYFLNDFYKDHCKIYQKRPIYWLFDSGKKNGFKCLIYMHRYRPDTIARIRTDYVHEQQARYRTAIADLENRLTGVSTSERVKINKQLKKLQDQADELHIYEEKIHHLADQFIDIDLDDGVKVNYAKFQDILAKIK